MSGLRPFPFPALVDRLRAELSSGGPVFGLDRRDWHRPDATLRLDVRLGGRVAANPFGPAAGPHTQLASNMVQGWLAGARVFELKTLQTLDQIEVARPCIHAPHYALNVEWSQELALRESVREYQSAAWLLHSLARGRAGGEFPPDADLRHVLDLSVGYSLEGVRAANMREALAALRAPASGYDELAGQLLADQLRWLGDPPDGPVAETATLSTFHGCPPEEVEAIAAHLLDDGWSVVVKFNPTLLGAATVRALLDILGYTHLELDEAAFAQDLDQPRAVSLARRLAARAAECGRGFGVKFTNTLVLRRDPRVFPAEAGGQMYLSGAPLRPLALAAAAAFVDACPVPMPLSFSGGVERANAADTLRCGFAPVTICTDLLRRGGQGRLGGLLRDVEGRLRIAGATSLDHWLDLPADPVARWGTLAGRLAEQAWEASVDPRLEAANVMKPPRKRSSRLERLDCLNCDLCLPVCPNGALFTWELPGPDGPRKQIGVLADACNACSNCETWCPEQGAPWRVKERWHQDRASLEASPEELDGCCLQDGRLIARIEGRWVDEREAGPADAPRFAALRALLAEDSPAGRLSGARP